MTGYRSSNLRHDCDGGANCYIERLPNWDHIIDCFPRKIRPTDVDGMVEIRGKFLFLEEKGAGVSPGDGQRLALRALASRDGVTVVFFRPSIRLPGLLDVLVFDGSKPHGWQQWSEAKFRGWLRAWVSAADLANDVVTGLGA